KKTVKRTLANLSDWPLPKIEALRRVLRDEALVSPGDLLTTRQTLPHGHVEAILAMIVQRLIDPCSKLATTRAWHTTTLAEDRGVADASEDELYAAMDWLGERQER